jgi:uncharacterized protein YegL
LKPLLSFLLIKETKIIYIKMDIDVPDYLLCPITLEIIDDPVVDNEGVTYERSAIMEWLKHNKTSPKTNKPLAIGDLKPNYSMKYVIQAYKENKKQFVGLQKLSDVEDTNNFFVNNTQSMYTQNTSLNSEYNPQKTSKDINVIAVCDVSGSMGDDAGENISPTDEAYGFSRLDLVKYSLLTIAEVLSLDEHNFGLVKFSTYPEIVSTIKNLDLKNLVKTKQEIQKLSNEGTTYIWKGINTALDMIKTDNSGKHTHIILLTDGQPSDCSQTIISNIKNYVEKFPQVKFTLHCFGYGYNLDTELLHALCKIGNGTFGYIPDCSMVSTVFINSISNIITNLEGKPIQENNEPISIITEALENILAFPWKNRDKVIETAKIQLESLRPRTKFIEDLLQDIDHPDPHKGQIIKAISDKYYSRWGEKHLLSYLRALKLGCCVNFKDDALQHFAGSRFKQIQERANVIFSTLDPPRPSNVGYSYGRPVPIKNVNAAKLNDSSNPCFTKNGIIIMEDGKSSKKVEDVQKGDKLFGGATVVCIVITKCKKYEKVPMIVNGSLEITKWHPIRCRESGNEWKFPQDVFPVLTEINVDYYYDFVLDSVHTIRFVTNNNRADDIEVCTFGHGFEDNDVIKHPFYGTHRVIDCLKKLPGWDNGSVYLQGMMNVGHEGLIDGMH